MAWESLAAALLLAAREAGFERTPGEVAHHAKTERERLCAAARKLRVQTGIEVPPAYEQAVETVVTELDDQVTQDRAGVGAGRRGVDGCG